jgi:hypothetical protein
MFFLIYNIWSQVEPEIEELEMAMLEQDDKLTLREKLNYMTSRAVQMPLGITLVLFAFQVNCNLQITSYKLQVTRYKLHVQSYAFKVTRSKLRVQSYTFKVTRVNLVIYSSP